MLNYKINVTSSQGLGFFNSPEPPRPPQPPPVEVLSSEASSSSVAFTVDKVNIGDVTILKGRVNTKEVFGLPNSDLVSGVYEGWLKLWEGSIDLVKALEKESQTGNISFPGKCVLEMQFIYRTSMLRSSDVSPSPI
ncbi:unnamed protein product [Eruca vesicaria subsp. sativa]|uniref:Uncharacterized protein n=1 Tax=Eruca vesicaria subsp. sativa TaxID=29727 RepID=A0ABC8KKD4_ERUVS|nr:unnamed protein product [Eruca vesicaria subsp. sativa]